jgi:hypothetical protein
VSAIVRRRPGPAEPSIIGKQATRAEEAKASKAPSSGLAKWSGLASDIGVRQITSIEVVVCVNGLSRLGRPLVNVINET